SVGLEQPRQFDTRRIKSDRTIANDASGDAAGLVALMMDDGPVADRDAQGMPPRRQPKVAFELAARIPSAGGWRYDLHHDQRIGHFDGIVIQRNPTADQRIQL